ncbi:carboxylating nicotinate-nucleotide diphosphorylase [bacterium]|nr:carboxylating nicotinate-nucleotide diphosphorylase [bacterium]
MSEIAFGQVDEIIINALKEDLGHGDITTASVIIGAHRSSASLVAKSDMVLAGLLFADKTFALVDQSIKFKGLKKDGVRVKQGTVLVNIQGDTSSILRAERVALNILQRLSGIATLTERYVKALKGTGVKILDTRKTAPGLRIMDKYAVKAGGGHNHRFGLFDGVMIKDNHIIAAGGIAKAVRLARENIHHLVKIEVETSNIIEVKSALAAGADVIMLDNMSVSLMEKAVALIRGTAPVVLIEASGNITLDNVRLVADTGVDMISVGSLTHSAPAADISLGFR